MAQSLPISLDYYEEIVVKFATTDNIVEESEEVKKNAAQTLQALVEQCEKQQTDFDMCQRRNVDNKLNVSENSKVRMSILEREKSMQNAKIDRLCHELQKLEQKILKEALEYRETQNLLLVKYDLGAEFNPEALCIKISEAAKNTEILKSQMEPNKTQLEKVTNSATVDDEFIKYPGVQDITKILEKESLATFGDPQKIKKRLAELTQNVAFLNKKIKEI